MEVRCNEGLATHVGPEPCMFTREGKDEASAGESAGQPLSRERLYIPSADAVRQAEGQATTCVNASELSNGRGLRPWHAQKLLEREPGDLRTDLGEGMNQARVGKARSRSQR